MMVLPHLLWLSEVLCFQSNVSLAWRMWILPSTNGYETTSIGEKHSKKGINLGKLWFYSIVVNLLVMSTLDFLYDQQLYYRNGTRPSLFMLPWWNEFVITWISSVICSGIFPALDVWINSRSVISDVLMIMLGDHPSYICLLNDSSTVVVTDFVDSTRPFSQPDHVLSRESSIHTPKVPVGVPLPWGAPINFQNHQKPVTIQASAAEICKIPTSCYWSAGSPTWTCSA